MSSTRRVANPLQVNNLPHKASRVCMNDPHIPADELPRRLGLLDATMIVVGIVIGAGIFLLPNLIAHSLPSGSAIVAVLAGGRRLSYCGALAYAELGAMMPATGGQYVYLREAFGGCCDSWRMGLHARRGSRRHRLSGGGLLHLPGDISCRCATVRSQPRRSCAVLVLAANYLGIKEGAWIQRIFTSLKIVGLLLLIGAAAFARSRRTRSADTGCRDDVVLHRDRRGHDRLPDGLQRLELCQLRGR